MSDDRNSSFGTPKGRLAELRPGLVYEKPKPVKDAENSPRLRPHDRKHIPKGSLAERIRKQSRKGA